MTSPQPNRKDSSSNVVDNVSQLETPEDARFRRFCLHYMQSYTAASSSAPWIVRGAILRVAQSFRGTSNSAEMLSINSHRGTQLMCSTIRRVPWSVLNDGRTLKTLDRTRRARHGHRSPTINQHRHQHLSTTRNANALSAPESLLHIDLTWV